VLCSFPAQPLAARETVDASPPSKLAVTLYRDPDRGADDEMDREWPRGFAMITETRTVTLPPGESTVRFEGVAEGMIAVSAIVTGLPGGTIEKNRNAELLSPHALVDGTLGNRVTVTRTNPATGEAVAEQAIVRTRADGGLVLQTGAGFEAVRCAGLPERLTFDRVPPGLSPQPVFSVDTRDPRGGTYTVQLTYIAWGFDWQAHYVATFDEGGTSEQIKLHLMSWLTLLNDNSQSFPDAELLVIAGRLNIETDFESLGEAPEAEPLRLTCYPFGSTARGSPIPVFPGVQDALLENRSVAALTAVSEESYDESVIVTGSRIMARPAMVATEEQLGDLKLYRVPEPVTVAAQSLKQVVFLDRDEVKGRLLYEGTCGPDDEDDAIAARMLLATVNDREHGLGQSLPMGGITVFEPSAFGDQLVAEEQLRDYARGQDVEVALGESAQVFMECQGTGDVDPYDKPKRWTTVRAVLTNANREPARFRIWLGWPSEWRVQGLPDSRLKDGRRIAEVTVPGNGQREVTWQVRPVDDD
jgi:hypothetical protein